MRTDDNVGINIFLVLTIMINILNAIIKTDDQ